jgi:phage antirepressor YoqD-like protein
LGTIESTEIKTSVLSPYLEEVDMSNNIVPNFVRFDSEGLELVVDTITGNAYASKSATARMLEIDEKTVRNQVNSSDKYSIITAQIPTAAGLRSSDLLPANAVFKLALKYHPLLAEAMGAAGANVYLLGLAGYKVEIEQPTIPKTYAAALLESGRLAMQIEQDREATELGKAIAKAPNNIRIGDFAKSIGMGQNRYFDELRDCGIIQQTSNTPYQRYLEGGWFVVTQIIAANGKTYPVSLITPKGQAYLVKRHNQYISRETVRDAIECQVVAMV